jgi:hypothetical protein
MKEEEKDLNYWKENAKEGYMTTPICVLKYISELEKVVKNNEDLKNNPQKFLRQRAIAWWNTLTFETTDLQVKYYPYAGSPVNLTGYQIQKIWEGETHCSYMD